MDRVSPTERPELFAATIGGVGLTGVDPNVCFRLRPVASSSMVVRERRMPDLDAFMAGLAEARETAGYSVGWIDGMPRGGDLGREFWRLPRRQVRMPLPPGRLERRRGRCRSIPRLRAEPSEHQPVQSGLLPPGSDGGPDAYPAGAAILLSAHAHPHWNRIYGKRGFDQFQSVIPDAEAAEGMRKLLEAISDARAGSFLAVLKTLGGEGRGYLSFPMRGYTLALDFPRRDGVEELLARLAAISLDHGGRVYLAKNSVLDAGSFARMYPKLGRIPRRARQHRPGVRRMQSDMARRAEHPVETAETRT